MTNTRFTCLGVLILCLITCGGSLTRIGVTQSANATIPGATLVEQLTGDALGFSGLGSFDITQSAEFKNQGVKREQINSVRLRTLTLAITAPPNGQDFEFLQSLSFFVESNGLPKKEVARGGPFQSGAKEITLTVLDVELAPYAAAASMTFTTAAKGQRPKNTTSLKATVILDADVNIAGVVCGGGT